MEANETSRGKFEKMHDDQLVKYKDAAKFLGISLRQVGNLKKEGKVKHVPVGKRGIRFRIGALKNFSRIREVG